MNDEQTKADLAVAEVESQRFEESRLPVKSDQQHTLTPAQARVEAVGSVLAKAYAGSSTLQLTPEEIAGLKADFPDDAFKLGAGGNPDLIYIEHAYLRDRFDATIGMGQWALVRSRPHWAEDFVTQKGQKAVRLYADCALLIRGCLVSEAVGSMVYYPNNASQDYSDAAEGSESAAFRRCAKKLGVGLQAWKKDFCAGWMERHRNATKPQLRQQAPQPTPTPRAEVLPKDPEGWKARFLHRVAKGSADGRIMAWYWAVETSIIMDNERIGDGTPESYPQSLEAAKDAERRIAEATKAGVPEFVRKAYALANVEPDYRIPEGEVPTQGEIDSNEPPGGWQGAMGAKADDVSGTDYQVIEGYVQASGSKPTKKGGNRWWFAVNAELSGDKSKSVYLTTFDDKIAEAINALPSPKRIRAAYSEDKWGMKIESVTGI